LCAPVETHQLLATTRRQAVVGNNDNTKI
jgi:hypothetical protein